MAIYKISDKTYNIYVKLKSLKISKETDMKKTLRSSVSLILAVLMLVSVFAIPASAEKYAGGNEYKQYRSVLTIGTSMIRGYGIGPYDTYTLKTAHGFDGNAPDYVAKAVGADRENCYLAAIAGETVTMPLWLLGLTDPTDDYLYNVNKDHRNVRYDQRLKPVFGKDVGGRGFSFKELTDSAELIIIELGLGDTWFRGKECAVQEMTRTAEPLYAAGVLVEQINEGFAYFKSRFPMLLDYIKENNPNAEVVLVGTSNSLDGVKISDLSLLPVGNAMDVLFDSLNAYIKKEAKEYGYKYADISDTEMRVKDKDLTITDLRFLLNMEYNLHPSDDGVKYMAQQILDQLRADKLANLELSKAASVKSVLLDAKSVKDFSFDPVTKELTVSCGTGTAKVLTVTYVGENGATYVSTYNLKWSDDNGYTSNKPLTAIVAGRLGTNVLSRTFAFFQSIGSFFKNLF